MKKKLLLLVIPLCLSFAFVFLLAKKHMDITFIAKADSVSITNGTQFTDISGNAIHAHGGGMLHYGKYYYWYGEYREDNNSFKGVRCYRSIDMVHWEYRGEVLTPSSATELNKCNIERPKVIYNSKTRQFVMWMHWENGINYGEARAAVAYCNSPDGAFTYQGSFRPYKDAGITDHGKAGYMSRDCNLFVDTDGTAYFISSSNENMDLHLYRLTTDYKHIDKLVTKLFVGSKREAPCLVKRNNYYYLITSGCTGWNPNQTKYAYSTSISSGWSGLNNLGDSTTYNSQPTYIIPIQESSSTSYIYMGDRWAGAWNGKVNDSKYVWLNLTFNSNTNLSLNYSDTFSIDVSEGTVATDTPAATFKPDASKYYKIVNKNSKKLLTIVDNSTKNASKAIQESDNNSTSQQWQIVDKGNSNYVIINRNSGKYLEVYSWSSADGAKISQWTKNNGSNQKWNIKSIRDGYFKIVNCHSKKLLDVKGASQNNGTDVIQYYNNNGFNQHWQLIEVK